MKPIPVFLMLWILAPSAHAIEGCSGAGCHDISWQNTPAHVWIDTAEHLNEVACVDCHAWPKNGDKLTFTPSREFIIQHCDRCHNTSQNIDHVMAMLSQRTTK